MKSFIAASLLFLSALPFVAVAQDGAGHPEGSDMEAMMKLWEQVSTPGEQHARLNDLVGSWTAKSTMWMDPEHPMESTGAAEVRWVLGKRFLQQEFSGEMMGKPLNGIGYTGYDIYNKKYVSFWIDNSSTAMFTSEGSFDQTGKVLSMYGTMDEWMTGERDKNVKYVTRIQGKDSFVFEVYDLSIGENAKAVQIEYVRKK
ncbi:MAG: DUF1579 domain-containing protein [Ignavibacteria bacterium]|nr:DUF1579 domain-containing protein [Ignavibacteria bacterium]